MPFHKSLQGFISRVGHRQNKKIRGRKRSICHLSKFGYFFKFSNKIFYRSQQAVSATFVLTINVPVAYRTRDVMILMRENLISRAIGRGGP
jgi:hypothetical protein